MPTYSYRCKPCRRAFDDFVAISERDGVCCSACGRRAERVFAPPVEVNTFKEDTYWFGPNDPVVVRSKRQLLDECERRGKVSIGYG